MCFAASEAVRSLVLAMGSALDFVLLKKQLKASTCALWCSSSYFYYYNSHTDCFFKFTKEIIGCVSTRVHFALVRVPAVHFTCLLCPHLRKVRPVNVSSLKIPPEWMKENEEEQHVTWTYIQVLHTCELLF